MAKIKMPTYKIQRRRKTVCLNIISDEAVRVKEWVKVRSKANKHFIYALFQSRVLATRQYRCSNKGDNPDEDRGGG